MAALRVRPVVAGGRLERRGAREGKLLNQGSDPAGGEAAASASLPHARLRWGGGGCRAEHCRKAAALSGRGPGRALNTGRGHVLVLPP